MIEKQSVNKLYSKKSKIGFVLLASQFFNTEKTCNESMIEILKVITQSISYI